MNLIIDNNKIEESFDKIAKELLTQKALFINDKIIRFTEIEFYYFHKDNHEDNYTHEHQKKSGEWRFHNQGIDITFNGDDETDGGILIRGILLDGNFINGPRKSIAKIFECFGKVFNTTTFGIKDGEYLDKEIIRTFRHLPNKITYQDYHFKHYRYLTDFNNLSISLKDKELIKQNHSILNAPK